MKKQGYNSRDDEAIAARNGKKKQSLKDRRNEKDTIQETTKQSQLVTVRKNNL